MPLHTPLFTLSIRNHNDEPLVPVFHIHNMNVTRNYSDLEGSHFGRQTGTVRISIIGMEEFLRPLSEFVSDMSDIRIALHNPRPSIVNLLIRQEEYPENESRFRNCFIRSVEWDSLEYGGNLAEGLMKIEMEWVFSDSDIAVNMDQPEGAVQRRFRRMPPRNIWANHFNEDYRAEFPSPTSREASLTSLNWRELGF